MREVISNLSPEKDQDKINDLFSFMATPTTEEGLPLPLRIDKVKYN